MAKHIQVFLTTNRFNNDAPYANATTLELPIATSYTPELIEYATNGIKRIYRQGFRYKKCGVMLVGFAERRACTALWVQRKKESQIRVLPWSWHHPPNY